MSGKLPDDNVTDRNFASAPVSGSIRLIDFESAEVVAGFFPDTYFLVVSGTKPYLNMTVELSPLVYVRQPEYWGIEVVGSLPGIGLPATAPYHVSIPLAGITGTKGVEAIGATRSEQLAVPPDGGQPDARLYVVIQRTGGGACKIIPDGDKYPAIYTQVYGPAPLEKCETWVAENCRERE